MSKSSVRASQRSFLGVFIVVAALLNFLPQTNFVAPPPDAVKTALGRRNVASMVTSLLGMTFGADQGQAKMPWEQKKSIYATFKFDMEGENEPGKDIREVVVRLDPNWAPRGVKQFKELATLGDFDDGAVYGVSPGKSAAFGSPAEPLPPYDAIKDDIQRTANTRGKLAFIQKGFHDRTNQLVFHLKDSKKADNYNMQPIGEVMGDGMDVIDQIYGGYGGKPVFSEIKKYGNEYLDKEFPKLSKIKSVKLSETAPEIATEKANDMEM